MNFFLAKSLFLEAGDEHSWQEIEWNSLLKVFRPGVEINMLNVAKME